MSVLSLQYVLKILFLLPCCYCSTVHFLACYRHQLAVGGITQQKGHSFIHFAWYQQTDRCVHVLWCCVKHVQPQLFSLLTVILQHLIKYGIYYITYHHTFSITI